MPTHYNSFNPGHPPELVGTWKSDPNDVDAAAAYGDVTLKFGVDGTLLYIVHQSVRDQIMRLTYLAFGGRKSQYVKVPARG